MLSKWIFFIGARLRNPELINEYKYLKQTEKWDIERLELLQLKKLKRLMSIAYDKSPYYKEMFDNAGIKVRDIKSLEDIKMIPITTKGDILNNNSRIQNKDGYKKLRYSQTSGSTGEPLYFYRNREWDSSTRAAQMRGYSWYGVKPWDRNGYFWGFRFKGWKKIKTKILDGLLNRFRIFSYAEKEIEAFAKKLKTADYLEGYSSMIYEVAKIINRLGIGPFNLKMVKGTSEKIYPSYQEEAKKAFGQKIVSEYGATETGLIAYECKYGHMHIVMENVMVEEIDGEAVITNLNSLSFPIIRYKLGDSILLEDHIDCPCGMKHKIIKEVLGRVGGVIYGNEKKYPIMTLNYIIKNYALKYGKTFNYQAIQKKKGLLHIYFDKKVSNEEMKQFLAECKIYFNDDMEVSLFGESLKRDYNGKFKGFISEVHCE